ncbi:MAG: hypothetical protein JRJ56_07955, partial [Deltaproteobacteria bacterium]|nr:hypothetical protein [Deltaproteobacteria bacterium]
MATRENQQPARESNREAGTRESYDDRQRVLDLRHLYRSITRMSRSEAVDTILNHLVEDIVEATELERIIVLYYDQQSKHLESRVFYGFEQIKDINVPFSQVNGLLKRAYADREPLNVLQNLAPTAAKGEAKAVKCGIFKDDYPTQAGRNRRRHINVCFKGIDQPEELNQVKKCYHFKHYSLLTYYQHDQTVESLFGDTGAFLI